MSTLRFAAALALPALLALSLAVRRPAASVEAGTAPFLALEDVVGAAEVAVVGTVVTARARLASDGLIETEYVLDLEERLVGDGGPTETVVLPGGVLPDGRGLVLPGVPAPRVGDETVLFLSARDARTGRRMTVGLEQGRYRLVRDREGRRVALGLGPAFASDESGERGHQAFTAMPYQELRARVEAALQRRSQGAR